MAAARRPLAGSLACRQRAEGGQRNDKFEQASWCHGSPPLGVAPAEPVRAGPLGPNIDDAFRLSAQCLNARLSIADGSLNPRRRTAKLLRARGSPGRLRPRCLGGAGIGAVRRRARRIGTPFGDEDLSVRVRPDTGVARLLDGGLRDRDLPPAGRGLAVPLGRRDQREDEYRKAQTTPALRPARPQPDHVVLNRQRADPRPYLSTEVI